MTRRVQPISPARLNRALDRYVRQYGVTDGVWCIGGDKPHLTHAVHARHDGFVACWEHYRFGPGWCLGQGTDAGYMRGCQCRAVPVGAA